VQLTGAVDGEACRQSEPGNSCRCLFLFGLQGKNADRHSRNAGAMLWNAEFCFFADSIAVPEHQIFADAERPEAEWASDRDVWRGVSAGADRTRIITRKLKWPGMGCG